MITPMKIHRTLKRRVNGGDGAKSIYIIIYDKSNVSWLCVDTKISNFVATAHSVIIVVSNRQAGITQPNLLTNIWFVCV